MKKYILLFLLVCLAGCSKEKKEINKIIYAMDTTIQINLYGKEENAEDLADIFYRYNDLANYNNSVTGIVNVYDLNKNAFSQEVAVSKDLFEFLEVSKKCYLLTEGYFNIAIGRASYLWKEINEEMEILNTVLGDLDEYNLVNVRNQNLKKMKQIDKLVLQEETQIFIDEFIKDEYVIDDIIRKYNLIDETINLDATINKITELLPYTSIDDLELNKDKQTVRFLEDIKLDLGGIAKGYALNKCVEYLKEKGIKKYMINAGSSSVALGVKENNEPYRIGLQNPINLNETYIGIKGKNTMISTSGDYQKYFEYGNEKYHHILNAKTLEVDHYYKTITIISDNGAVLDAFSTALFCMDIEEAKRIALENDVECVFYLFDGQIVKTDGVQVI